MTSAGYVRVTLSLLTMLSLAACARGPGSTGTETAARPAAVPALPTGVTLAMIAEGDSLFNTRSCWRCHGTKGVGAVNGPALAGKTKWDHGTGSYADIVKTVISGVPKDSIKDPSRPNAMRARDSMQPLLTDPQVSAVAAYVWSLSHPVK